ncbi:bud emergence protein 1 [Mortierella sp. GBA30]|nr:bud emergence protein 1 [Mortierella sp. GBA30]
MPNLRRSLQNKNTSASLSPTRAPATALAPPRKVIKALYDYNAQTNEELSFVKGDFFHVVGNEDDEDWYEACNPITGARGYVPVTYFQILEKTGAGGNGYHQQHQQQRQRNSNQSLEDSGNDSGSFTDLMPQHHTLNHPYQHTNQQQQQSSHSLSNGGGSSPALSHKSLASPSLPKCQPLYGIVLYDFGAERTDELDCKVGDAILVIAQSNEDWYVAKPIGRLGGPGLIPVSFVEIRDMVTGKPINVPEMLRQTGTMIPRVEEWKKQAMEYKAKSIPLGRIDTGDNFQQQQQQQEHQQHLSQQLPHGMPMHPQQFHQQQQQQNTGQTIQQLKNKLSRGDLKSSHARDPGTRRNVSQDLDIGRRVDAYNARTPSTRSFDTFEDNPASGSEPSRVIHASVESFHHEDDQYWFTVRVEMASGAIRNLFRLYEDFYNFHIALLEEFPVESGRVGDQPRILPFMPIPLQVVTDTVSASRRTDLDGYVQDLCRLPARITQHPLVEQLFAVKDGDTETFPATARLGIEPGLGPGPSSPGLGRSPGPNSMRESERRPSIPAGVAITAVAAGGSRTMYGPPRSQGQRSYGDDSSSGGASPSLRSQAQFGPPATTQGATEDMIKVKISYQEDIMAMRIPVSISFKSLQQKIFERLHADPKTMSFRDDRGDFAVIQTDADVKEAIDRSGGKLMIYVD